MEVLLEPCPWRGTTRISGMAKGSIKEVMVRIAGAFAKLALPYPEVEILINLLPA